MEDLETIHLVGDFADTELHRTSGRKVWLDDLDLYVRYYQFRVLLQHHTMAEVCCMTAGLKEIAAAVIA